MPRQAMTYTVPQPIEPLNIEEVKFWLQIMQEHALFIKAGLPCEDTALIDEANAFQREFEALLAKADRVKNVKQNNEFINETYDAVKEFYEYKREILRAKLLCQLGGTNFPLFLDHVSREAEYFLRLLDKMRNGRVALKENCKTQETVFWLRIMADHAKFISHLLDPSERNLIQTANDFSCQFDNLVLQGRDFASMLHSQDGEVMAFRRFLQDVRADVQQLRDFKRAAEDLIAECRLLGIIPELLADHLRREAEHFLLILAMMERGLIKTTSSSFIEDVSLIDEDDACTTEVELTADSNYIDSDDARPPVEEGKAGLKTPKFVVAEADDSPAKYDEIKVSERPEEVVEPEVLIEEPVDKIEESSHQEAADIVDIEPESDEPVQAQLESESNKKSKQPAKSESSILAKASQFKAKPNSGKHQAVEDGGKKTHAHYEPESKAAEKEKGAKYKWGGKFPRSLGKVKD